MNIKRGLSRAVKLLIFLLIAVLLFSSITLIFLPKWRGTWKSSDTVSGFYALEEDSIDTLILGSSQVISGVSSMQLYQQQGIRAYSLGTERQPMMASYYLLKDALRTQPNLKAVVLEVTELFQQCEESTYRKAFDYMPLSSVKWEAIQDHVKWEEKADEAAGTDTAPTAASYLLPILAYHDRWYDLDEDDFTYFLQDRSDLRRGFSLQPGQGARGTYLPLDTERTAVCAQPKEEALFFLQAVEQLCQDQNLSLTFLKTPRIEWSVEECNTVQALAKEYDVPYLDFNTTTLGDAIGYDYAVDNLKKSPTHLNLWGAQKLTAYLGSYLAASTPVIDARTNPKYAYMDAGLLLYQQEVNDSYLTQETDFKAYLSKLYRSRYSVLVAVNGAGTGAYPDDIKRSMEQFGLDPRVTAGGCYVAAVEHGTVLADQWSRKPVTQSVTLADGISCTLTSDDTPFTPVCSITVDGTKRALSDPGLNIVVYNHETGKIVDSVAFDFTETEVIATR